MQINEAGSNDKTTSIKLFVSAATNFVRQSDFCDASIAQQNVHESVDLRSGIDKATAPDQ